MKIIDFKTSVVSMPFEQNIGSSTITLKGYDFIIITMQTDEEIEGLGYVMTPGYGTASIHSIIKDLLCPIVIGEDPFRVEYIWDMLWNKIRFFGQSGVTIFGLAAVDMCIWDIIGKVCNQPLYKILGAYSCTIPVYASGGWLTYSIKELSKEMEEYVKEGYSSVKMKIGHDNPDEDYRRVKAVKKVVGENVKIMADANQKWSTAEAIKIGKKLQDLGVVWFEEPVAAKNLSGQAQVAEALELEIAAGESAYTLQDFKDIIISKSLDIVQINYFRSGGITEWRRIAALAKALDFPVSSQSNLEIQVHLMSSIPNGLIMEDHTILRKYMEKVFEQLPQIKNGLTRPPDLPGIGLNLLPDIRRKHDLCY